MRVYKNVWGPELDQEHSWAHESLEGLAEGWRRAEGGVEQGRGLVAMPGEWVGCH